MYQHLSKTAKEVLKLAHQFARRDQQEYVGSEHVLLAIINHGLGIGAQILQNCGLTFSEIYEQVRLYQRRASEETWVLGRLPGTPHFKQIIAFAIEEAEYMRDNKVGTEYLLLGLLREKGCTAEIVLRNLGLNQDLARKELAKLKGKPQISLP